MRKENREVYICEGCGSVMGHPHYHDEEKCLQRKKEDQEARERYFNRVKEIEEQCIEMVKDTKALKLLIDNGFKEEAYIIIKDIYSDNVWYDIGSSVTEEIYDKMYNTVRDSIVAENIWSKIYINGENR